MERFNAADGEQTVAQDNDNLLPTGETPLNALGVLPVAGTLGAAGGFGGAQGTTGPLLPGASLYPVVAPLTEYEGADQSVADRAEAALAEDGRLSSHVVGTVHIAVQGGMIVLTGTIPTDAERQIAERICAHVPGARGVENRLTVGVV